MIIKAIQDDIFNTDLKHIAFSINKEGFNDEGFAGKVASKYWNDLFDCGNNKIGTILAKTIKGKTFYAIVSYSLIDGWKEKQAEFIKDCFDKIDSKGEEIATIAIGDEFIETMAGSNIKEIICGMHDSKQKIVLYSQYKLEQIIKCYNEYKEKTDELKILTLIKDN